MQKNLSIDEKFINKIFQKYLKAKLIFQNNIDSLSESWVSYQENNNFNENEDYLRHLEIVETILALLPKAECTCLINDYLITKETSTINNIWWKEKYSQNDYQKLRIRAISRFLYLFLI